MTPTPSVYVGVVSARSRRLRTIGTLLLLAVALMTLYGYFILMPPIHRAVEARRVAQAKVSETHVTGARGTAATAEAHALTRAQQAERLQVATAFAYWGVCALLVITALFVAWLDLREISRNYIQQRRQLWTHTADRLARESIPDGETTGGQERS